MNPILIYTAVLALLGVVLALIIRAIWHRLRQSPPVSAPADRRVNMSAKVPESAGPVSGKPSRGLIRWPKRGGPSGQPVADPADGPDAQAPVQRSRRLRTLSELERTGEGMASLAPVYDYAALEARLAALFESYLAEQITLPAYIAAVRQEQADIVALISDQPSADIIDDLARAKSAVDWCLAWAAEQSAMAERQAA